MTANITRIGYSLGPLLSMHEVLTCSKLADLQKNVDSIWLPESWGRESFVTLGAVSQVTKKIKLGTSIVNIYARTPATVAMAATSLDILSNNRTNIGLGTSTEILVQGWHGVKFEKPVERMREYVECLKLMIKGEKVVYDGKFFKVKNFKIMNTPQRERIPIFVAAVNKKMISLASELADGVLFYLRPLDELKKTVADLKHRTEKRDFEIASTFIGAISNEDPEKARKRAARTLAFYVAVGKYYNRLLSENGFRNEVQMITSEYNKNGVDAGAKLVPDKMLDSLAVCGTSEDCIRSVNKFISAGITLPIIQVNPVADAESSFREMLSTF